MKYLALIGALFIGLILAPLAVAQQELYRPPLGDIMGKIQLRHIKLWFAGKLGNWELATYEADEIRASLEKAADLYRGIPVELMTNTADPIQAIRDAIAAKDGVRQGLWRPDRCLQRLPPGDRTGLHRHSGADRLPLHRPVVCAAQAIEAARPSF